MNLKQFLKKNNVAQGDHIAVTKDKTVLEGTVLPSTDSHTLVLKLDSGYNIGLAVSSELTVKRLAKGKPVAKPPAVLLQKKPGLPDILILHTGGTIASRVDYRTGAVFSSFTPQDLLSMFPKLGEIANINARLLGNMFSEDMRFAHYTLMAKAIGLAIKKKPKLKGIIVSHGTDTLGYSAAALAFALQNLPVPVLLVGAQRSSDRGSSDAHDNLVAAATFIAKTDFAGVAICMHEKTDDGWCAILPATKTRKLHSSRRDAFQPVNASAIARVNAQTGAVEFVQKNYPRKPAVPLQVKPAFEEKVALVKMHPNFSAEQLKPFEKYKGLVIEGTGLGQMPTGTPDKLSGPNKKNFDALKKILANGGIVVMASQCVFGRVQMHVYDKAVDLANAGVIAGEDMLAETALVKLAWLLANYKNKDEIKLLVAQNLVGEISPATPIDGFV